MYGVSSLNSRNVPICVVLLPGGATKLKATENFMIHPGICLGLAFRFERWLRIICRVRVPAQIAQFPTLSRQAHPPSLPLRIELFDGAEAVQSNPCPKR